MIAVRSFARAVVLCLSASACAPTNSSTPGPAGPSGQSPTPGRADAVSHETDGADIINSERADDASSAHPVNDAGAPSDAADAATLHASAGDGSLADASTPDANTMSVSMADAGAVRATPVDAAVADAFQMQPAPGAADPDSIGADASIGIGTGSCCSVHDSPGCSNADLQVCVCEKLSTCCTQAWTAACVLIVQQKYCQPGVRDCVCGTAADQWGQAACCDVDWSTGFCNDVAESKCGAAPGCM